MEKLRYVMLLLVLLFAAGNVYAEPVDINTADAATLAATMKGIGPQKAEAIVAYRNAHGPFASLKDLTKVKGIGMKTVEQNSDLLVASPAKKP